MIARQRSRRSTLDTIDLLGAALVAPLVVPFVVAAWFFTAGPMVFHAPPGDTALARLSTGFGAGVLYGLPVAYVTTLFVALPAVLLLRRLFGPVHLLTLLMLGAVLGFALSAVIDLGLDIALGLFPFCGAATAAAFWWFGARHDVPVPNGGSHA